MSCGSGGSRSSPVNRAPPNKGKDAAPLLSQKEREEKIRQFREQQEEERRRRLYELQHATVQAQKHREQLEDERRKKIEDLRLKELERRQGVEERKRMIWEAEQERKEAILRRNLEREARIEARRNAQRNSMSFAFGSSTPRTFDLDLAALGPARTQNSILFSATSNKRTDDRDLDPARRHSGVDNFDRKPEDITYFAEGVIEGAMNNQSHGSNLELSPQASFETKNRMYIGTNLDAGDCMDISEYNDTTGGPKRTTQYRPFSSGCLVGSGAVVGDDPMSRSMISLSSASRARRKTDLMPAIPREYTTPRSRSPGNHGKRAVSMTRLDQLALPRRKYTGVSTGTSNANPVGGPRTTSPTLSSKETPCRPRSSMSATSEQSVTSSQVSAASVKMRNGPRRVRPVSIGGVPSNSTANSHQQQSRQGRSMERKALTPTARHIRAKSAEQSQNKLTAPVIRRPAANQKSPKAAKRTPDAAAIINDGATSTVVKTPDQSLSPEPDTLQTQDRHSPEANEDAPVGDLVQESPSTTKPRISSEEEAKAALAEKRRLAREQAEREAEIERQRQEELRRQEEERKRQEEEAQRKFEEEQMRLAELHRLQEDEKLKKAIEEQQQREEEERERLEEETKMRLEKEEQERKAREEAEKQRKELEERLRREEAERAERKKRVEQIMSRTRKAGSTPTHPSSSDNSKLSSPEEEHKPLPAGSPETTAEQMVEEKSDDGMLSSAQSSILCKDVDAFVPVAKNSPIVNGQDYLQEELKNWNPFAEQTFQQEDNTLDGNFHSTEATVKENGQQNLNSSECLLKESDSGVILADHSPDKVKIDSTLQSNGYNHHDEDRSYTDSMSPEEKSEISLGVLLDFSTPSPSQNFTQQIVATEFHQLIDIGAGTTNQNEVNLLNSADEINSNKVPGNPFIAFEEPITRKQDNHLADLLS